MADYGMKFSQVGADVSKAADNEIHFTSEWPSLKVMNHGLLKFRIAVLDNGVDRFYDSPKVIFEHKFDFVPAFIPYTTDLFQYEIFRDLTTVNDKYVTYNQPGGGGSPPVGLTGLDLQVGLVFLGVDITKNYKAPVDNPMVSVPRGDGQPFGLKMMEDGSNVNSPKLGKYLVQTESRAPLLHEVSVGYALAPGPSSGTRNYVYVHDLPYNPIFFVYLQNSRGEFGLVNNFSGITTNGRTISVLGVDRDKLVSIVVLKDPFNVAENTIKVTV